jgi:cytoskeletal protein RodZ
MTGAKRNSSRQPPWEGPEAEGVSFGTWLRHQREVRQINLREVAESSKISLRYLQAFEQDRFDLLPASVFAKGFLRQYAEYVGLDGDEVVNHYLWARGMVEPEEEEAKKEEPASPNLWPVVWVVVALALIASLVWWVSTQRREQVAQEPPVQEFIPPPVEPEPEIVQEASPETPVAEFAAPLVVTLEFSRDCWVDAVIDGGARRITQTFLPGEPLQIEAQESIRFRTLGNSGGVSLEVNGLPFPLEGREGRVLKDLRIDLETLAALRAGGA